MERSTRSSVPPAGEDGAGAGAGDAGYRAHRAANARPARPLARGAKLRSDAVAAGNRAAALAANSAEGERAREREMFLGAGDAPEAPGAQAAQLSEAARRARRRESARRAGRKALATFMAVVLAIGLMPLPAFAADGGLRGVSFNGNVVAASQQTTTTVDADGNVSSETTQTVVDDEGNVESQTTAGDGAGKVTIGGREVDEFDGTASAYGSYFLSRASSLKSDGNIQSLHGHGQSEGNALSLQDGIDAAKGSQADDASDEAAQSGDEATEGDGPAGESAKGATDDADVEGASEADAEDPYAAEDAAIDVSKVEGDFSAQRIVVALNDGASLQPRDENNVVSEGAGLYVLGYKNRDAAKRAYVRYTNYEGAAFVAPDAAVEAAAGEDGDDEGDADDDSDSDSRSTAAGNSASNGQGSSSSNASINAAAENPAGGNDASSSSSNAGEDSDDPGSGDADATEAETDAPVADLGTLEGDRLALEAGASEREAAEAGASVDERTVTVALIDTAVAADAAEKYGVEIERVSVLGAAQPDAAGTDTHGDKMLATLMGAYGAAGEPAGARIVSIEALDGSGRGSAASVYAALSLAAAAKADVVSMSFAGYDVAGNEAIGAGVEEARRAASGEGRAVALLAAAGNMNQDVRRFVPASCEGVQAVGALDAAKAPFDASRLAAGKVASSNYGEGLVWAVGETTSYAAAAAAGALSAMGAQALAGGWAGPLQTALLEGAASPGGGEAAGQDDLEEGLAADDGERADANPEAEEAGVRAAANYGVDLNICLPNFDQPYATGAAGAVTYQIGDGEPVKEAWNEDSAWNSIPEGTVIKLWDFSPGEGLLIDGAPKYGAASSPNELVYAAGTALEGSGTEADPWKMTVTAGAVLCVFTDYQGSSYAWGEEPEGAAPFGFEKSAQQLTVKGKCGSHALTLGVGVWRLEAWGGSGGTGTRRSYTGAGGAGGYSKGSFVVSSGAPTVYVTLGGPGANAINAGGNSSRQGGYNGGGAGSNNEGGTVQSGSGGGATHFAASAGRLSTLAGDASGVVLVAGGGGGGTGYDGGYRTRGLGGAGGGESGGDGTSSWTDSPNARNNGEGGTQTSGYKFGLASGFTTYAECAGGGGGWWGGRFGSAWGGAAGGGSGHLGGAADPAVATNEFEGTSTSGTFKLGGATYTISGLTTVKDGAGWTPNPLGTGAATAGYARVTRAAINHTLVVDSTRTTVYITPDGGGFTDTALTATYDLKPAKDGMLFMGFFSETGGRGTQLVDGSGSPTEALRCAEAPRTAYAYWTKAPGASYSWGDAASAPFGFDRTGQQLSVSSDGASHAITFTRGLWQLEAWGGSGGTGRRGNYIGAGGTGGYSKGSFVIGSGAPTAYVTVGGAGRSSINAGGGRAGGYNGGGYAFNNSDWNASTQEGSGGGATHFASAPGELLGLESDPTGVMLVAGGGGGGGAYSNTGYSYLAGGGGGGEVGLNGTTGVDVKSSRGSAGRGYGGTQTSGGICVDDWSTGRVTGSFGSGGYSSGAESAGGGGGWWGGGGNGAWGGSGGGGSGHLGGAEDPTVATNEFDGTSTSGTFALGGATYTISGLTTAKDGAGWTKSPLGTDPATAGYARVTRTAIDQTFVLEGSSTKVWVTPAGAGFTDTELSSSYQLAPTKGGYVFGGWYTGENGAGEQLVSADGTVADGLKYTSEEVTVYAYFYKQVSYYKGAQKIADDTYRAAGRLALSEADAYALGGKGDTVTGAEGGAAFTGWDSDGDGEVDVQVGDEVGASNATIALTAVYASPTAIAADYTLPASGGTRLANGSISYSVPYRMWP